MILAATLLAMKIVKVAMHIGMPTLNIIRN
jgi:hypothetical protein